MTEEEFVSMAEEKYGIRAGEPVRYNPRGDTYTDLFLAGTPVGRITDCVDFGKGVQGRMFVLATCYEIKQDDDFCFLSDITEDIFRKMLSRSEVTGIEHALKLRHRQSCGLADIHKLFYAMGY